MVHVDLICVKFEGQVHRSQNKTATTTVASAARAVNVYTAGDLWWMWLISDRNLLWLNVVLKWSVEPGLKAFLVICKFTVWVVIIIIHTPVFMVMSSWPKPLREFTQFIWWMQTVLLLTPKADTYFTMPQRVEGWVDLATAGMVGSPCPRLYIAVDVVINTAAHDLSHCSQSCGY